ncbi:HET-domain-containing protein [Cucurbitaria berberidis CBS 394.84]|uniref:HET-domain-containing protein n=1 Tax=Cucurbitaria berberidis CBS 394.84 TaxID=1168544 RepID=A0A9P4GPN4_9PLEO|nr:HET-domain-containing protein [Cucurbitaria berberidis CBS 394.84]KAF1849039.1 HET-domain-containing protein [Cucurbitaria berberidis CBS 394.84]
MEQDHGDSIQNVASIERIADRSQLKAKRHLVIQRCFRKPTALSLQLLQKWHKEYNAADGNLKLDDAIIQEVQIDTLDEDTVERCITELAGEVPVTNGFCGDCQHLFNNWPDLSDPEVKDPSTGLHWPGSGADWKHTVAQECHSLVLEAAARNGCRFCAFVMQVMRDAKVLEIFRKIEARLEYLDDKAMASLSVQNWGRNSSQLLWINFPGKVCDHCNYGIALEANFESAALEHSADTYDKQRDVLDIANSWIERCSENHEDCNNNDQDVLPSRLISIASDVPRLVLTKGWEMRPRYSTLSHRWGDENFLKLTEENQNSLLSMIPLQELPKTFRDAIHISRRLGLEYLWIDSLCIIQGNTEDWRREASLMSSVYGGSFINIAAASAVSVHEGCFLKTPHLVDGLRASITVSGGNLVRDFRSQSVYRMSTTDSHLATRAWAFQEKILPPRTIHFGNRGAFWECRTMTANEFLPDGFKRQLGSGLINQRTRQSSFEYWWDDVVRLYSTTDLTYSQDKLPALSGIVRQIHNERGGQYLAGMWREDDIEAQLCWKATNPRRRPSWRAPSWSWASIDGGVSYKVRQSGILDDIYAHVLDAEMTFLGQNPFGEVSGGRLRIACSGMLAARFDEGGTVKIESDERDINADAEYPVSPDCLDDEWRSGGSTVYLLPLLGGKTGSGRYVDEGKSIAEMMICGILLRESGGVAGQFCRIGMFQFWKDEIIYEGPDKKEKEYLEPFLKAFKQGAASVAESVCAEVVQNPDFPDERYVIYIV